MNMKKTIYILLALLLGLTSCVKELDPNCDLVPKAAETGLVAVTMELEIPAVQIQAFTKANTANTFSENPQIDNIRVAVFGTSGYPQAYTLAEPVSKEGVSGYASTNNTKYYFKVLLPPYEGEAHVHIIANGDESIPFVNQTEASIMEKMKTTDNVGAFWARIVLPDGILPEKDQNGIMKTDNQGNFEPDETTAEAFTDLKLIRNFAEVTLTLDALAATNLKNVTWTLVNVPTMGSVAPMKAGAYVDDYWQYSYNVATGKMEYGSKTYNGFMFSNDPMNYTVPAASEIQTSPKILNQDGGVIQNGSPMFMYERVHPGSNKATCLLVKANFQPNGATQPESTPTYYRVDLTNEAIGGVFPIYRNYRYQVKIHKVGNRGSEDPDEAMKHPSGGNVSQSTDAQKLTDISDGYSRLYVEYVEKNFTSGGKKTLWVQYVPDVTVGNGMVVDNRNVTVKIKDLGGNLGMGTALVANESQHVGATISPKSANQTGYNIYEFELNGQSELDDLVSMLEVKAHNGVEGDDNSTLYRDITLRVLKKMDMSIKLNPKQVAKRSGENTVLEIELPDGLPESMFPLEFYIEDVKHTLNPTGKRKDNDNTSISVPVKVGASLVDGSNSFCFIRTVNYSEYQENNTISTQFATITSNNATTVYVYNEYFTKKYANLLNGGIKVTPTNATVDFYVTSIEIDVEAATDQTSWTVSGGSGVTITNNEGNTITGGTGTGKFTMHFLANSNTSASARWEATVRSGSGTNEVTENVTITQLPSSFAITPQEQTVSFNATEATVTVNAAAGTEWTATVNNGASIAGAVNGTYSGSGTETLRVTLGASTTTSQREFTVEATLVDLPMTVQADIYQRGAPIGETSVNVASNFTYSTSDRTGEAVSADGYITIALSNIGNLQADDWFSDEQSPVIDGYAVMGRRPFLTTYQGSIKVTPQAGVRITGITVTYSNDYGQYDSTGRSASPGSYTVSNDIGTWTGSSTSAITITNGYYSSWGSYTFPRITDIKVTYEPIN